MSFAFGCQRYERQLKFLHPPHRTHTMISTALGARPFARARQRLVQRLREANLIECCGLSPAMETPACQSGAN